ncbi:hypothetical protein TrRE_jg3815 [Triparma retinervis]|uniref:Uncharacterized protein n=1 Tax=Triparma retinervis TaxID=2557542 RepID=A0A9W7G518_9STRA|nr:hypothetical protein TrRE_jg3815 [Triparma retinervis]
MAQMQQQMAQMQKMQMQMPQEMQMQMQMPQEMQVQMQMPQEMQLQMQLPQTGGGIQMLQMPGAQPVPAQPTVPSVQVQVPVYGGGGTVMTEYNGKLINVPIPADATAGATIMVPVPEMGPSVLY